MQSLATVSELTTTNAKLQHGNINKLIIEILTESFQYINPYKKPEAARSLYHSPGLQIIIWGFFHGRFVLNN